MSFLHFDWPDVSGAFEKITEEAKEVDTAIANGNEKEIIDEIGDLLFAVVNVARKTGVDPEEALTRATDKFSRRFEASEKMACEEGVDMKSATLEKLDEYWEKAKKQEQTP